MNKAHMYNMQFLHEPTDLEIFLARAGVKWNKTSDLSCFNMKEEQVQMCQRPRVCLMCLHLVVTNEKRKKKEVNLKSSGKVENNKYSKKKIHNKLYHFGHLNIKKTFGFKGCSIFFSTISAQHTN